MDYQFVGNNNSNIASADFLCGDLIHPHQHGPTAMAQCHLLLAVPSIHMMHILLVILLMLTIGYEASMLDSLETRLVEFYL